MPAGRPSKYKPEYTQVAAELAIQGKTEKEIATALEVSVPTFRKWKSENPELLAALKFNKDKADEHVERSLYQRAMGYSTTETDIRVIDGKIVKTEVIKQYPPDTTAMIFWLKNRKPKEWRDKRETEISGTLNLTDMTDDDLERAIAAKEAALKGAED